MKNITENKTSSNGIGFLGLLCIVFIVLKLTGVITWSWLWVLAPLWIPLTLTLFLFVIITGEFLR
jgi:hypothetical protein